MLGMDMAATVTLKVGRKIAHQYRLYYAAKGPFPLIHTVFMGILSDHGQLSYLHTL